VFCLAKVGLFFWNILQRTVTGRREKKKLRGKTVKAHQQKFLTQSKLGSTFVSWSVSEQNKNSGCVCFNNYLTGLKVIRHCVGANVSVLRKPLAGLLK
jgi:hypothetical protein